jgi:ABC-type protease/lipase transport system fused ATPase/permease subunit
MIMVVQDGMVAAYGTKDEIMAKLAHTAQQHQKQA